MSAYTTFLRWYFSILAKVFPGQLNLKMDYNDKMADKTSTIFQTESKKITDAVRNQFSPLFNVFFQPLLNVRPRVKACQIIHIIAFLFF